MLKYLHIENIAVIESAEIEPVKGFNALSGETGAGKSIIIDSINAVLGERTSKELIRNDKDKALVSALFSNLSDSAKKNLYENGFKLDEDGNLVIQRVLSQNGNGSIKINGQPTTTAVLKEIGKKLINIHGQHDSQVLLRPENHYLYLDLLAGNKEIVDKYYEAYKRFVDIRREIKALETDEDKKQDRIDLLKYQISELKAADIKVGEYEQLKKSKEISDNYEKIAKKINECVFMLSGDDDTSGAITLSDKAARLISDIQSEEINSSLTELTSASATLHSVAEALRNFLDSVAFDPKDSANLQERLEMLYTLMLKYGGTEERMLEFLGKSEKELSSIELGEERLNILQEELLDAEQNLVKAGQKLTDSRLAASCDFTKKVCEALASMDMSNVQFLVDVKEGRYTKTGKDVVEFFISANAGETVKPLYKVASGGELSRIMLAIKSIIADKDDVDTLIFDEIDNGISGRAASKVALQLKKVSKARQVICVTHLAQIAAAAEGHFLIEKRVADGKTYTKVELLENDSRIEEIARIMSGTALSENTIQTAKELLDRSKL